MLLPDITIRKLVLPHLIVDLPSVSKEEAIRELCQAMAKDARVRDQEALRRAMLQREAMSSTGIGAGLAFPHVKIPQVTDFILAIGRSRKGIAYEALDHKPVHLIFMLAASDQQTRPFIHVLARISEVLRGESVRRELLEARDLDTFFKLCQHYEW